MIQKLGAIYWIFGSSYEETVSFKRYRIEFLQILPNDCFDLGCLMRVQVHIYENDEPLMMEDVAIEFWKGWSDSTEVDDIGVSCNDNDEKYYNKNEEYRNSSFLLFKYVIKTSSIHYYHHNSSIL